ncbi:hypothetical protein ABW19_dt0208995 [Dactylella cylindrospora]|nr:hypothetical protein ABW19_dt0208995 [Dactylella cylindrospora]
MTADSDAPQIELCPLPQADGSCQYTCPTSHTSVLTAVNGPIEVRAKDELPNHATIEVIVKPGIGVGGVRETRISTLLQTTLKSLILTTHHPRSLIQITAQILQCEDNTSIPLLLTPLLNCTILSLLVAGVPMKTTAWSVHLAILPLARQPDSDDDAMLDEGDSSWSGDSEMVKNPGRKLLSRAKSSHTISYSKEGEMMLVESMDCSAGSGGESADKQGWRLDEWFEIMEEAKRICCTEGVEIIRDVLRKRRL